MDIKQKKRKVILRNKNFSNMGSDGKTRYFTRLLLKNFSMSEQLAKAIGTVVVRALTENANDANANAGLDSFDTGLDNTNDDSLGLDNGFDDLTLDDSDLPESSKDSGKVDEAETPKAAPDLSEDFAELKDTINNHSESVEESRYDKLKMMFFTEKAKTLS